MPKQKFSLNTTMNYCYPSMNHHMLDNYSYFQYQQQPQNFPKPLNNRFIYVKQNFLNQPLNPAPKVLVNPHFKKKVYVNPQFNPPQTIISNNKPKIHINPNVLKNFTIPVAKVEAISQVKNAKTTVISTRNKLVRIPCNSVEKNSRKRRNSLHTKYKIVNSSSSINKTGAVNKFKLDKRTDKNTSLRIIKKRYVYVNRFLSMNIVAKSVLLKKNMNLNKPGFVNINGILYKKSPNSLRKASDATIIKSSKPKTITSKYKLTLNSELKLNSSKKTVIKRYKVIRCKNKKILLNKLRKCNIPCQIFRKFGKCKGKEDGSCIKLHNPDQIILCTRFLQGACLNEHCLLSHKVSPEKMPTCKYYLDGLCAKDNCPYLHVKISPKADICKKFLEGFCPNGAQCDKRHQFLCPDFEKNKVCPRKRCPYPHGNSVRNSKVLNKLAKKCSVKKVPLKKETVNKVDVLPETKRYYADLDNKNEQDNNGKDSVVTTFSRERPKLGTLPAFIPFFESK